TPPAPPPPPPPPPPVRPPPTPSTTTSGAPGLDASPVDADCTVYFRTSSCFPGDPLAVASATLDAVRKAYPVRREECAMGGPDYERRRMENEGRYTTTCEAKRCVLHDAGPRKAIPF
ncbi:MAG TPA: hypothetical protein VHE35_22400, partial [Kofleriaceae bacterium]|nr:hypothetical protein [Kofleriaceae bacterium]